MDHTTGHVNAMTTTQETMHNLPGISTHVCLSIWAVFTWGLLLHVSHRKESLLKVVLAESLQHPNAARHHPKALILCSAFKLSFNSARRSDPILPTWPPDSLFKPGRHCEDASNVVQVLVHSLCKQMHSCLGVSGIPCAGGRIIFRI